MINTWSSLPKKDYQIEDIVLPKSHIETVDPTNMAFSSLEEHLNGMTIIMILTSL